jgi:tripartite-type tricarboxylate transporter receptor subunit TctC
VHVVPDLPTIAEAALPGYEMTTWNGLVAPASTPREVVARLNSETLKALRTPDLGEKLRGMGLEILAGTPEQFAAFMRDETVKWARVVKASGARIE